MKRPTELMDGRMGALQDEYEQDRAAVDAVVARLEKEDRLEAEAARMRRTAMQSEMRAQRQAQADMHRVQAEWERAEDQR